MLKVTLVTNDGNGQPTEIPCADGTTLDDFLRLCFDGYDRLDDFTIRVRSGGVNVADVDDYLLQDGDRVSIAPAKIEGAGY